MSPSSIFSFDTLALKAAQVGRGLGVVLMVVAWVTVVSVVLERVEPIELYGGWGQYQIERSRALAREYATKHGRIDVMLFGNSVFRAVDVAIIEKAWAARGVRAYNASIGGSRPEGQAFILEHAFLSIVKPKILIYEVGPRDLRDPKRIKRHRQAVFQSVRARAASARTLAERVSSRLEQWLYLFAARREIRRALTHGIEEKSAKDMDERGVAANRPARLVKQLKGASAFPRGNAYRSRYNSFLIHEDGAQQDVRRVIEIAKRAGVEVVLVNMPIAPACFSLFDAPERDYARYLDTMRAVVRDTGVTYFDVHAELALENADFANADHPAKTGNDKIAHYLADRVLKNYFASP